MIVNTQYGIFKVFPPDVIGKAITRGEFWDACLRPYMDVLQPGEVFIDAGANIGFFPVYLGKKGIICHAFEASPSVYEVLCKNIQMNGLLNDVSVNTYNVALYDKETILCLHKDWRKWPEATVDSNDKLDYTRSFNSGWLCLVPEELGDSHISFNTKTLDSFEIKNVKLIKVDVQGCDLRVLYGARETIKKYRPVILWEYEGSI